MPWARFADDFLGNPKLTKLSTWAIALDMAGIIYSARELRDGHLSVGDVQSIAALIHLSPGRWVKAATDLVVARRWAVETGGWAIHDYLDYQPSREHVLAERAAAAERQRRKRSDTGQFMPVSRRDTGRTSGVTPGEVPPESGRSHSAPGPGVNYRATGLSTELITPETVPESGDYPGARGPAPSREAVAARRAADEAEALKNWQRERRLNDVSRG